MSRARYVTGPDGRLYLYQRPDGGEAFVPLGGSTGEVMTKRSDANFDVQWADVANSSMTVLEPSGGDDTAAINAAIQALTIDGGGEVVFKPGYYLVSSTINVGLPIFDSDGYAWMLARTTALGDPTPYTNAANVTTNLTLAPVSLRFLPGAYLVATWTPSVPTPVVAYNLGSTGYSGPPGEIHGLTVISSAMLTDGAYDVTAVDEPQTNNLIGLFSTLGCRKVSRTFFAGLHHGHLAFEPFWCFIDSMEARWIGGDCLSLALANAVTVDNLGLWDSARGVVFDGAASAVRGIHTEHVAQDLTVFECEVCTFGPAYLEDTSAADGAGQYAVKLGDVENTYKVLSARFVNIRVGSARPNKGAFRMWGCHSASFDSCRTYGKTVTSDLISMGLIIGGDFDIATDLWTSIDGYNGPEIRLGSPRVTGTLTFDKAIFVDGGWVWRGVDPGGSGTGFPLFIDTGSGGSPLQVRAYGIEHLRHSDYETVAYQYETGWDVKVPVAPRTTTLANLELLLPPFVPAGMRAGSMAHATDARKSGEGAGVGTGCMVWFDGTNWRTFYDNAIAAD